MIVDDDGADAECLDQLGVCSMDTSGGLAEVAQQDAAAAALSEGESPVSRSGDTISRAPCREGGPTFDGMDVGAVYGPTMKGGRWLTRKKDPKTFTRSHETRHTVDYGYEDDK